MTTEEFRRVAATRQVPPGLNNVLLALLHDARGEWQEAHRLVQEEHGSDAARVHAYLHRKEGDESNARYWYARARQTPLALTLDEEWEVLVRSLLGRTNTDTNTE